MSVQYQLINLKPKAKNLKPNLHMKTLKIDARLKMLQTLFVILFLSLGLLPSKAESKYKYGDKGEKAEAKTPEVAKEVPAPAKQIIVDLSEQRLTFKNGGKENVYRISSGKLNTPAPVGDFKVVRKYVSYLLKEVLRDDGTRVHMPHWLMIDESKGLGIHGVENDWGLLYPASGGCIRMNKKDAEELFPQVDIGTSVSIVGSAKEYVDKYHPFPWQGTGLDGLIVTWTDKASKPESSSATSAEQYGFNKGLTPETISEELREKLQLMWAEGILGANKPTPRMIAKDSRWKETRFINFPHIPEMGSLRLQAFDTCLKRYFTVKEFEALVGLPIRLNDP